jgi:RsiW-degrading membrane proteinase PrsW (M82 family)
MPCKHGVDHSGGVALNRAMSEPSETNQQPEPKKPLRDFVERTASSVQKRPVNSVVWAFFVGIFLTVFPIGRIVGAAVSLLLALLRPALLLLGVVKLFEEIEHRRK